MADRDITPAELREKYLPVTPTSITDLVWGYAYREGHASGSHEIEQIYEELAEIVTMTETHTEEVLW